jgi:uncharacterized protein (DUF1778 family)
MTGVSDHERRTISIRVPSGDLAMIDRAAFLRGCSRANFVRQAAVTAAFDPLLEQTTVRMSREAFADFLETLARPPEVVSQLAKVSRHAPR